MFNPALTEMAAKDRIIELRVAAARRSPRGGGAPVPTETAARVPLSRSGRRIQLANPQREIGWFLVGFGLRLAVPRTRAGSAR